MVRSLFRVNGDIEVIKIMRSLFNEVVINFMNNSEVTIPGTECLLCHTPMLTHHRLSSGSTLSC